MLQSKHYSVELGKFDNVSGSFIISDPCYAEPIWCQQILSNVALGKWKAMVNKQDVYPWGDVNSSLIVLHDSIANTTCLNWQSCSALIGTDSAKIGIFDTVVYNNEQCVTTEPQWLMENKWFGHCCDLAYSQQMAGVVIGGAVSRSGARGGLYSARYACNTVGEVIAVEVIFVTEDYHQY